MSKEDYWSRGYLHNDPIVRLNGTLDVVRNQLTYMNGSLEALVAALSEATKVITSLHAVIATQQSQTTQQKRTSEDS